MTTNHPERLDTALIRPGRVDVKEHFGHATSYQMVEMFLRFYGGSKVRAEEFANIVSRSSRPVSTAFLQGLFILHKDKPEDAIREAERFSERIHPESD